MPAPRDTAALSVAQQVELGLECPLSSWDELIHCMYGLVSTIIVLVAQDGSFYQHVS